MPKYTPTIGLEIHAELDTETKMFCDSVNDPEESRPNTNVCPVCLGHPGTLPTINKQAVEHVIRAGLAFGGQIAAEAKFDRKNYFYPDLPKGYQVSQYDQPLVEGGNLNGVALTRIHLEEDTGTLIHDDKNDASLVDYNRAGMPLMELVTEPDIKSAEQAVAFARELQRTLRYLGASRVRMERGEFRVEVNISLMRKATGEKQQATGKTELGTKVELKNLNSFKVVEAATAYEIERQRELLDAGKEVVQETRGWNEQLQKTVSQRSKEEAKDYRYFPEPDLPPFSPYEVFDIEKLQASLPELPAQKRERFAGEYSGVSEELLDLLIDDVTLANFFEQAVSEYRAHADKEDIKLLANYFASDLRGLLNERSAQVDDMKMTPEHFGHLVALVAEGKVGSRTAKDVLVTIFETGNDPMQIIEEEGLEIVEDTSQLQKTIDEVISEQPQAVEDYRSGKEEAVKFLLGQAMKKLRGSGDPNKLEKLFKEMLGK